MRGKKTAHTILRGCVEPSVSVMCKALPNSIKLNEATEMTTSTKTTIPTLLIGKEAIEKSIVSITNRGKLLDASIQLTGLSCLNHIQLHGDVTVFNTMFLGMPKGSRKAALTEWALAFGKVVANTGDNKKTHPFLYAKERATNLEGAVETPWYEFKLDKAPDEVFDIFKALAIIIKKASAEGVTVVGAEHLEALKAIKPTEVSA